MFSAGPYSSTWAEHNLIRLLVKNLHISSCSAVSFAISVVVSSFNCTKRSSNIWILGKYRMVKLIRAIEDMAIFMGTIWQNLQQRWELNS